MNYTDKVVIVTGGSKGIGKGCVQAFAAAGAKVIFCSRNASEGKAVEAELNAVGPKQATFISCDVAKSDEIKRLIDDCISMHGRLDCLINNAGWHPPHKSIDEFSVQDFRDLLELNMVSVFAGCKFALPYLRQTQGNIINLSSLVAAMGQLHATTYDRRSKQALSVYCGRGDVYHRRGPHHFRRC
ncbi:MAG TPA: SDR family NAD(P)-dependent oxidoreductase [Pyrinomonadaceae bacterium]|nr:SDR family NAD(P)-dependent oxidoreductase [Pyrinomonadaceae bacterium]